MRARLEPTQLEHLSDASFLGKLLVLSANVRLDLKGIARYKYSSLFGLVVSNEGKKFYDIDTRFTVTGLRPGTGYVVSISSANGKGRSDLTKIEAYTAKQPERMTESGESALTKVGEFTVTPILAILMVVGGALFLVFLVTML